MNWKKNLPKSIFIVSLIFIVLLYGVSAGNFGWFPQGFLDKAVEQARGSGAIRSIPFIKQKLNRGAGATTLPKTNPRFYKQAGVKIHNKEVAQPGLTLISSLWDWDKNGDLDVGAKLINTEGQTLHSWQLEENKVFPNTAELGWRRPEKADYFRTYLFPNGDLLINLLNIGLVRVNSCGEVIWRLKEFTHHTIDRGENGTFWMPAAKKGKLKGSKLYPNGFPGLGGKKFWIDRILHVSENGEVLNDINILDILYKNDLERYIPKFLGGTFPRPEKIKTDLTHLNDVEVLESSLADEYPLFEAGDLLVSLRALHLVFVFDPETLKVKWHATGPFIYQHDPDFIGNGWIGVFNNNTDLTGRGKMLGGSQIVAIKPETGSEKVLFPTKVSAPFYTAARGGWQLLDNGNMLLFEEDFGRIAEVSPKGYTVWEWFASPVGDSRIPATSSAHRYDLTKEDVASWPCSSVSTSENTEQEGG